MKMKKYFLSLVAPLSMLMVLACSPDQYHQKGEYDDVYFTRADRKQQPEVVNQDVAAATTNTSQATVPAELQEKYNNNSTQDPVYYYEEQGVLVQSANDLNYDDFVTDYENGYLAYYELPLDWDTDWSRSSFNDLMVNDFQFRMAWYDQYYKGDDFKMNMYLSGRTSSSSRNWNLNGPQVGLGFGTVPMYGSMYYGGMMGVDLNPWGYYDPFWRPINRWSVSFGFGSSFGYPGFGNYWNDPFYCPNPFSTGGTTVIVNNGDSFGNERPVTRSGRLRSTSVSTVARDSQNGAQIRARSQRASQIQASSAAPLGRASRADMSRSAITSARNIGRNSTTRADLTSSRVSRASTDQNRVNNGVRTSRISRDRISASRNSSGRSTNAAGISRTASRAGITRADVSRSSRSGNYSRNSSSLTFDRTSSSSISRSVASRNSYSSSSPSRGFSSSRNSSSRFSLGNSRNSSSSRISSGSSSRSSSGRSSSGVSRSSSGSSRSGGSVSRSSSSSRSGSSSSGSSRSGRN